MGVLHLAATLHENTIPLAESLFSSLVVIDLWLLVVSGLPFLATFGLIYLPSINLKGELYFLSKLERLSSRHL